MRKVLHFILILAVCSLFMACAGTKENSQVPYTQAENENLTGEKNGEGPASEDILDFYYTYENINYNAEYQRYRFYTQDGKHMFFHEHREVKDDYGPATEKHTTATGNFELTADEWKEFLNYLARGTAKPREEAVTTGDSGPWMFLYLRDGDPDGLDFSLSYGDLKAFEDFCEELAKEKR